MYIELKLNDTTSIELYEASHWHNDNEIEVKYTAAWVVHKGKEREVDPYGLVRALERRFGEDWRLEAYVL